MSHVTHNWRTKPCQRKRGCSLYVQASLCVQAEAVVNSAQQAAGALASQEAAIAPDVALAVLQRLGRLGTPEASAKLEV